MSFTPRTTAPTGTALDTYWNSFTGECVWYTIGRIREVAGTPKWDPDRAWPVTLGSIQKAKQIYPNADEANGWIKDGTTPSLGAIACWTGTDGHCMNVEEINGTQITLSGYNFPNHHSFSLLTYDISTIINGIPGLGAFQGFVRNPYVSEAETPRITVNPSSYNVTMTQEEDTKDFSFEVTVEGIPSGESISGGESFPSLTKTQDSGWNYTPYTGADGNIYQKAVKTLTLQYEREGLEAYQTVKHLYYNLTFSNGSISSDTPINITVELSIKLIAMIYKTDKEGQFMIKLI